MQIKNIKSELKDINRLIRCAQKFGMLGDLTKMKICYLLCNHKELSVSEIAKILGVSISAVSHALKKLKSADIVDSRKVWRQSFYRISDKKVKKLISISL